MKSTYEEVISGYIKSASEPLLLPDMEPKKKAIMAIMNKTKKTIVVMVLSIK
jgi:hypothetical protein